MYESSQPSEPSSSPSFASSVQLSQAESDFRMTYPVPAFLRNDDYGTNERSIPNLFTARDSLTLHLPPGEEAQDSEFAVAREFPDSEFRDTQGVQSISLDGHVLGGPSQEPTYASQSSSSTSPPVPQAPTQPQIPDREARLNFLERLAAASRAQAQSSAAAGTSGATITPKEPSSTIPKQTPISKTYIKDDRNCCSEISLVQIKTLTFFIAIEARSRWTSIAESKPLIARWTTARALSLVCVHTCARLQRSTRRRRANRSRRFSIFQLLSPLDSMFFAF